jgi:hypothetical protein
MNIFLLATKKRLFTSNLIYHQKLEHLNRGTLLVKNFVLPRWCFIIYLCRKGKLMEKLWLHFIIYTCQKGKSMAKLWLHFCSQLQNMHAFVIVCWKFLAPTPSLSIVYCVHLHSITWWRSWVLQCLQIFGFSSCNVVMKKLPGMVMLVFFLNIVCQPEVHLILHFRGNFLTTYSLHLCSFFASKVEHNKLWNV